MTLQGGKVAFDLPFEACSAWELIGTHTVMTTPVGRGQGVRSKPDNGPTTYGHPPSGLPASPLNLEEVPAVLSDVVFKLLWREEVRDAEGVIIAVAKERANHYLGRARFSPACVTNHLPDVELCLEYESLSTGHIRAALGIRSTKSRILAVMISKKYSTFDDVEPAQFTNVIWQVIRSKPSHSLPFIRSNACPSR